MHDMLSYVDVVSDPGRRPKIPVQTWTPGATVCLDGEGKGKPCSLDMQEYLRGVCLRRIRPSDKAYPDQGQEIYDDADHPKARSPAAKGQSKDTVSLSSQRVVRVQVLVLVGELACMTAVTPFSFQT